MSIKLQFALVALAIVAAVADKNFAVQNTYDAEFAQYPGTPGFLNGGWHFGRPQQFGAYNYFGAGNPYDFSFSAGRYPQHFQQQYPQPPLNQAPPQYQAPNTNTKPPTVDPYEEESVRLYGELNRVD